MTANPLRTALDAIGQLPDSEIDLADAALQLARIAEPDLDWRAARAHLTELARDAVDLAAETPAGDLAARAGALAGLMAGRHGYRGDTETYDDLDNANLIRVIERRRGLPVALGILWLHAARAAGWAVRGINFPGHFLIALEDDTPPRGEGGLRLLVLDLFDGGKVLDRSELTRMLRRTYGQNAELGPNMLAAMSTRDVLLRLQVNIKTRLLMIGQTQAALAVVEDMLRLAPNEALVWREAAEINQRLDRVAAALKCYERFLELFPHGEAATRARAAMGQLRARLN
jgi:regulator of sirC expression with transglutaminase-like and TPR domain